MPHSQPSLLFEIQNLKGELASSRKQADKYAHLIATLLDELNNLKNNMCPACKINLAVPAIAASAPMIATASTSTKSPSSSPLRRRVFQGRQPRRLSRHKSLSVPRKLDIAFTPGTPKIARTPTLPCPNEKTPKPQSEPPKLSAVYHPEVKRALDFQLAHLVTYGSRVLCAKACPDGERVAIGLAYDGKTYINELKTGTKICVLVDRYRKLKDHINILSVQFSPDGQVLATGASDNEIRIWDVTQKRMRVKFKGHRGSVSSIAFSPNGWSLVSGSLDHSVRIWNIRDGSSKVLPVTGSTSYFISVIFSPNGRYIAGGNWDHSLWIWDLRTHSLAAKWWGHTDSVRCTEFTPDGKGLMTGSDDRTVKYWDVSSLASRQAGSTGLAGSGEQGFPEIRKFSGHTSPVRSIQFLPGNGEWIVTGSGDQTARVWDTKSGLCQLTLQGHMGSVRQVDVSRTQNLVVTASDEGSVALWRYEHTVLL